MNAKYRIPSALMAAGAAAAILFASAVGCGGGGGGSSSAGTTGVVGLTDLGAGFTPTGVNNFGQVVGSSVDGSGNTHALLYTTGKTTDLGNLGGASLAYPSAINDNGQISGYSTESNGSTQAFVYQNNAMAALGVLTGSIAESQARSIAPNGEIAGNADSSLNPLSTNAVVWKTPTGPAVYVGALAGTNGENYALAVNGSGEVVGVSLMNDQAGNLIAEAEYFSWGGSTVTDLNVHAPETLGVTTMETQSGAINASGEIAVMGNTVASGTATDLVTIQPGGKPVDQGPILSLGGINSSGQVVGATTTTAFLFDPVKGMIDLNSLLPTGTGVTLTAATSINDKSQVSCVGTYGGSVHGYLFQLPATLPKTVKKIR